jgi:hypothetical protein
MARHNIVEHDASISRNDFGDGTGDNVHFNETTFAVLANANPGKDYYDPTSAGQVQQARLAHSIATNPLLVNTRKEFVLRSRESGLYLSIFGNALTGIAPKKYVTRRFTMGGMHLLLLCFFRQVRADLLPRGAPADRRGMEEIHHPHHGRHAQPTGGGNSQCLHVDREPGLRATPHFTHHHIVIGSTLSILRNVIPYHPLF